MEYFIYVNYIVLIYNAVQVLLVYIYLSIIYYLSIYLSIIYLSNIKNKFNGDKLALLFWGGGILPGLRMDSCLMLGNELSKETYMLTKQETLLGRGTQVESKRVRETWRTTLPHGFKFWVLW